MHILSAETPVHTPRSAPTIWNPLTRVAREPYGADEEASESDAWVSLARLAALASEKTCTSSNEFSPIYFGSHYTIVSYRPTSSQAMNEYFHSWEYYRNLNYHLAGHSSGLAEIGHFPKIGSLMVTASVLNAGGPENWQSLMHSIDRWELLPVDWDGDDGIPPPKRSASAARRFLNAFASATLPPPSGFVAGDGEIGFRWRTVRGFASISLLCDGTTLAFCRVGLSNNPLRIEAPADRIELLPFIESVALIA